MSDITDNVPRKHMEDLAVWYKRCQAYYQEHWSQKEAKFREDLKNGPQRRYCASVMEEVEVLSAFENVSEPSCITGTSWFYRYELLNTDPYYPHRVHKSHEINFLFNNKR